jgi:hypothetical protein
MAYDRHVRILDRDRDIAAEEARGLAAGEAEGSQGVGKSAGGQRSGQRGDIHADAATRHPTPLAVRRRGDTCSLHPSTYKKIIKIARKRRTRLAQVIHERFGKV